MKECVIAALGISLLKPWHGGSAQMHTNLTTVVWHSLISFKPICFADLVSSI